MTITDKRVRKTKTSVPHKNADIFVTIKAHM